MIYVTKQQKDSIFIANRFDTFCRLPLPFRHRNRGHRSSRPTAQGTRRTLLAGRMITRGPGPTTTKTRTGLYLLFAV